MKRGIAAAGLLFVLLVSVLPISALAAVPNRPENQYVPVQSPTKPLTKLLGISPMGVFEEGE